MPPAQPASSGDAFGDDAQPTSSLEPGPAKVPPSSRLSAAAWALRAQFFVSGALFATWGVHVPTVKAHYGLGEQSLALAMLASGVGAIIALAQAGRVVGRFGPRGVAAAMSLLLCAAVAGLLLTQAYAGLLITMVLFGCTASLFDVAINAEASEIEGRAGRPLMSGFHAMFSLGGMVGAGAGSLLPGWGIGAQTHLLLASLGALLMAWAACLAMLPLTQSPDDAKHPLSLPRGPLALIGLLAALGLMTEGAMYDWSVLFLRQERQSDSSVAALGYASFSLAMAMGRFGGDWVRARLAPVRLLVISGVLAAVGMATSLAVPVAAAGLVGFALVGLGLSNVVPVLFSAASRLPGIAPAHGIAAVSAVGYLGMMAGPPLIGLIAEHRSLTMGLGCVVLMSVFMALAAPRALGTLDKA